MRGGSRQGVGVDQRFPEVCGGAGSVEARHLMRCRASEPSRCSDSRADTRCLRRNRISSTRASLRVVNHRPLPASPPSGPAVTCSRAYSETGGISKETVSSSNRGGMGVESTSGTYASRHSGDDRLPVSFGDRQCVRLGTPVGVRRPTGQAGTGSPPGRRPSPASASRRTWTVTPFEAAFVRAVQEVNDDPAVGDRPASPARTPSTAGSFAVRPLQPDWCPRPPFIGSARGCPGTRPRNRSASPAHRRAKAYSGE